MGTQRVLVVNDEASLRTFFNFNLHARGYEVMDTIGSPSVFELVQNEHPDLVILDLMIQGIYGFELCRNICQHSNSSVIAFNMRGGDVDLLTCLNMGVDDYLGKPFGVDELMSRVRAVLRFRNLTKQKEIVSS